MPRLNLYEQQTSAQGPRSSGADFGAAPAQALEGAGNALFEIGERIQRRDELGVSQNMMDVDVPDTNPGTKRSLVDDGPFTIVENRKKKGTHKPPINPGFSNKTHPKRRFTETSKILPDPPQANRYISLQAGSAEASDHSDDQ